MVFVLIVDLNGLDPSNFASALQSTEQYILFAEGYDLIGLSQYLQYDFTILTIVILFWMTIEHLYPVV